MSEQRFLELRTQLEADAWQPEFEQLRARRTRRTQRYALAVVAAVVAVTLVGASLSVGLLRGSAHGPVPGGGPTNAGPTTFGPTGGPQPSSPSGAVAGPTTVTALTAAGGRLFAVTNQCAGACDGSGGYGTWRVLVSADLGATWKAFPLDAHPAAGASGVWATDAGDGLVALVDAGELRSITAAAGDRATFSQLGDPGAPVTGSAAGDKVWVGWGKYLWRQIAPGNLESPWGPQSGPIGPVAALTADTALYAVTAPDDTVSWHLASAGAAPSTRAVGDPCAGTPYPGTGFVSAAVAHPVGGAPVIWVTCSGGPGAGQEPKSIVTSTDGEHWQSRGAVETVGYADSIVPFSATGAWRYGSRAAIYRTTDGTHWKSVAATDPDGPMVFAALDMKRAIYLARAGNDALTWYSTTDGGAHWSSRPFTG